MILNKIYILILIFFCVNLAQTKRDLDLYKGDSHTISFESHWDVSSDSLLFVVKADRDDDTDRVIALRNEDGGGSDSEIEVIYSTKSTILVKLTQINTEGLNPAVYVYDLSVDSTTTLYTGYFKLRDEVGGSADGVATRTPYYTVALDTPDTGPALLMGWDVDNSAGWVSKPDFKDTLFSNDGNGTATLGDELLTNPTFTDSTSWDTQGGWTFNEPGVTHSSTVGTLTQDITVVGDSVYQIQVWVSGRTTGVMTIKLGSLDKAAGYNIPTTYSGLTFEHFPYTFTATASGSITFTVTPEAAYDGKIDSVNIKKVQLGSVAPTVEYWDADGDLAVETREDSTLFNTFYGLDGGRSLTTGHSNVGFGSGTFYSVTSAYHNVAYGRNSMESLTTGWRNVGVGMNTLNALTVGDHNTAMGYDALALLTSGRLNTGVGTDALYNTTTGRGNSAFGFFTLQENVTGEFNSAYGYGAGYNGSVTLETLSYMTFLGYGATSTVDAITNSMALGNSAQVTKSNQVVIGNSNVTETILRGDVLHDASFVASTLTSGTNAFDAQLTADTVTISGATVNDRYSVTLIGSAAPSANDFFRVRRIGGAIMIIRSASGTSGLEYMWTREKYQPTSTADSLSLDLIAYYDLEEASGSRTDKAGFNDLTDNNTVLYDVGIQDSAALFDSSNSESLSIADNTFLSMGANQECTFAFWVKPVDIWGNQVYLSKWNTVGDEREYSFELAYVDSSIKKLSFRFSTLGTAATQGVLESDTTLAAGSEYFVVGWYDVNMGDDTDADSIFLQINNGKIHRSIYATGIYDGTANFMLGASDIGLFSDALVDEVGIWKRILSAYERTYLYNSGSGRTYSGGSIQ